jgi:hypothetical protein
LTHRYDAGRDLAERYPHVQVERVPLDGALAATIPGRCLILIDVGLDRAGWDSCLAHEIVHLDRDDRCSAGESWFDDKRERAVDLEAARRLITIPALAGALLWDRHPDELAAELGVDTTPCGFA